MNYFNLVFLIIVIPVLLFHYLSIILYLWLCFAPVALYRIACIPIYKYPPGNRGDFYSNVKVKLI